MIFDLSKVERQLERLDEIFAKMIQMNPADDLAQEGQEIVTDMLEELESF